MREEYIGSNEGALVVLPICDLWDEIDAQRIKCRRISTSVIFIQLAKMWCGLVLLWCYATASLALLAVLVLTCGVGCRPLCHRLTDTNYWSRPKDQDQKISRQQDQDNKIKTTHNRDHKQSRPQDRYHDLGGWCLLWRANIQPYMIKMSLVIPPVWRIWRANNSTCSSSRCYDRIWLGS